MRLRNVKGAREAMVESPFIVQEPKTMAGRWSEWFGNDHPIYIEIGMGKGKFLTTLAQLHPEINYIGIEKFSSVLIRGVEKQEQLQLPNLALIRMDAEEITEVFGAGEVKRIYLNFSDPWPKDRHAKRRLTSVPFMNRYDVILAKDGQVEFKTDNVDLFAFSLDSIRDAGWKLPQVTRDLHHSDMAQGNVMTEYEERFTEKGNAICKLVAVR